MLLYEDKIYKSCPKKVMFKYKQNCYFLLNHRNYGQKLFGSRFTKKKTLHWNIIMKTLGISKEWMLFKIIINKKHRAKKTQEVFTTSIY